MDKYDSVDLTGAVWRKSSESGPFTDNCVEVAFVAGHVAIRDSRRPDRSVLIFDHDEWHAFLGGVRRAEFDLD